MRPDYKVAIWNFNNETVPVKLLTLIAWKHAMKVELAGFSRSGRSVFAIAKEFLSAPNSYANADMYAHIKGSIDSINEQLGIA
jgi:hypothetical protein